VTYAQCDKTTAATTSREGECQKNIEPKLQKCKSIPEGYFDFFFFFYFSCKNRTLFWFIFFRLHFAEKRWKNSFSTLKLKLWSHIDNCHMAGHSIEAGKVWEFSREVWGQLFHASMPHFSDGFAFLVREWTMAEESVFPIFFLEFFAGLLFGQQRVNAAAQKCSLENL